MGRYTKAPRHGLLDKLLGKPGDRQRRRRLPAGPLLALLTLLAGLFCLLLVATGGREEPVTVVVEEGDTLSAVAGRLEEAGAVGSSALFELRVRLRGEAGEIKPGEYRIEAGEGDGQVLDKLASGDSVAVVVTLPEGLTLEQTVQTVAEQSGIPAEELRAAARRTDYGYAFLDDPAIRTTEGFLFPKSYEFETDTSAPEAVDRLLEQYLLETRDLDFAAGERLNLTPYQVVTVASLVEEESASPEERPLVAAVIYNRMWAGMPLQIDATVQYALGGKPKENLTFSDLEVESPYNTYENRGLPPGPISNPSRESLEAALAPADTDHLYYVLEPDGARHFFTDDYDEFLEAKKARR